MEKTETLTIALENTNLSDTKLGEALDEIAQWVARNMTDFEAAVVTTTYTGHVFTCTITGT